MNKSSAVTPLFEFLTDHKYKNLHTRKTKQVNKIKVLKHLHGIKLSSTNIISGYYCGLLTKSKLAEIEYEIDHKGTVLVKFVKGLTKTEALEYIDGERKNLMAKIEQKPSNFFPKYKKNNFYLKRSANNTLTASANKAVSNEVLSNKFVNTMAKWNLSIIEGHK
jgi:hypothetical protein